MEFELNSGTILPYIASNALASIVLWLAFRRPDISKGLLGVLFVGAGIFNIYNVFTNPSSYLHFADTAVLDFYKSFIFGTLANHPVLIISGIALGQLYIGLSMMYDDWRFRSACTGGIVFGLAIAPLGVGSAFPSSIILSLSFLVMMIGTGRKRQLNRSITYKV